MHDIRWIRDNPDAFDRALKRRGLAAEAARLIAIDERRRAAIGKAEAAQARRNAASKEIGAAMPGMVVTIAVKVGDKVTRGQKLFTVEAMKMETTISSDVAGRVAELFVKAGSRVEAGDLLLRLE